MKVSIRDVDALLAVSPTALAAYARVAGWRKDESYGAHSDVYVGDALPEIVVPRTEHLGDYANVVWTLIQAFSEVADQDELTTYRSLVTADRDVIRIRVGESDDGSLGLHVGADLVQGAYDMVLATACSLHDTRSVYRMGANREAVELAESMRLGQTDQGSFVVTLLTPTIPPATPVLLPDPDDQDAPAIRRLTRRLVEALEATRRELERTVSGDESAFNNSVSCGVSANLCEALAQIIEPFPRLDVRASWARTRPMTTPSTIIRFGRADAAVLGEAARGLRERSPKPDMRLHGFVHVLERGEEDTFGTIRLRTEVDGYPRSVITVLDQVDYGRALEAHKARALVVLHGDLECAGQRWRLLNPRIESVLHDDEQQSTGD